MSKIWTCMRMQVYVRVHVYMCMCVYMFAYTCTYMHTYAWCGVHVCMCVYQSYLELCFVKTASLRYLHITSQLNSTVQRQLDKNGIFMKQRRSTNSEYTPFSSLICLFIHSNFVPTIKNGKNIIELLPGRQIGNQGKLKDEFLPEHSSIDRTWERI